MDEEKKQGVPANAVSQNDRLRHSRHGRRKRARRKETLAAVGAVTLLFAVALLCFLFFFKVQHIEVSDPAQQRYTNEQIAEASGIRIGENLFLLKTGAAEERLKQALPFLENVTVKRKFPSSVTVSVTYARPAMAVPDAGGYILLNAEGKVLQTGVRALSDFVAELRGVTVSAATPGEPVQFGEEGMFETVTGLARAFAQAGFLDVTVYDVSDLQNVTVEVNYKIDVKLGSAARAAEKLALAKAVIEKSLAEAARSASKLVVDLTVEGRAFVRTQSNIDKANEPPADPDADPGAELPEGETEAETDPER